MCSFNRVVINKLSLYLKNIYPTQTSMKSIKIILPILSILFLISCKPIATNVNSEYVGYWQSSGADGDHTLSITSNGQTTYNEELETLR